MADGTQNIRQFVDLGRQLLGSLEESAPLFVQLGQIGTTLNTLSAQMTTMASDINSIKTDISNIKTDVSNIKTDVTNIKADITNIKSDVNTLKSDLVKTNQTIVQIKADAQQSQENAEKRQYNQLYCCTPEAKINWITIFGKVKPDMPATMQGLIGLPKTRIFPILDYYNIPEGELEKNKVEIAKFMGIRTLQPI